LGTIHKAYCHDYYYWEELTAEAPIMSALNMLDTASMFRAVAMFLTVHL
jgi:hypothetical protein